MDKGHLTALLCGAAATMMIAPCRAARAQFLAGGRVDGVEAAEPLSPTDRGTLVPMGSSIAVRVRGSGRCNLAFEVNHRRVYRTGLTGLPGVVSIPYALDEQMRQRAETVHVVTEQPCFGEGTVPLVAGGELKSAMIVNANVDVGTTVAIALGGRGVCGSVTLRDSRSGAVREETPGVARDRSNPAPIVSRITTPAPQPGADTVTVTPGKQCAGSPQQFVMTVRGGAPKPEAGTILGISGGSGATVGVPVPMSVAGKGPACPAILVTFGDGSSATLSGAFPLNTQHAYARPGHFAIGASAAAPQGNVAGACTGSANGAVDIVALRIPIAAIIVPQRALVEQAIPIGVTTGGPSCSAVQVNFGDGTSASGGAPSQLSHQYGKAGTYVITAAGANDCQGGASATVVVAAKPGTPPIDRSESDRLARGGKPAVKGGKP